MSVNCGSDVGKTNFTTTDVLVYLMLEFIFTHPYHLTFDCSWKC